MELSFFEIVLVALIALLVLGPEDLARKAHKAGAWIGKMRTELNNWKIMAQEELIKDPPAKNSDAVEDRTQGEQKEPKAHE